MSENSTKGDPLGRQGIESLRKEASNPPPPESAPDCVCSIIKKQLKAQEGTKHKECFVIQKTQEYNYYSCLLKI